MPKEFGEKMSKIKRGKPLSEKHKNSLSKALTGRKRSIQECLAISRGTDNHGKNHPRFKGYYVTPMGTFDSPAALIPIITLTQMKTFCNKCERLISKAAYNKSRFLQLFYAYDDIKDKTYKDLGFWRDYI